MSKDNNASQPKPIRGYTDVLPVPLSELIVGVLLLVTALFSVYVKNKNYLFFTVPLGFALMFIELLYASYISAIKIVQLVLCIPSSICTIEALLSAIALGVKEVFKFNLPFSIEMLVNNRGFLAICFMLSIICQMFIGFISVQHFLFRGKIVLFSFILALLATSTVIFFSFLQKPGNLGFFYGLDLNARLTVTNEQSDFVNMSSTGWGPDRPVFTIDAPSAYPVFNSIIDDPTVGDERDFVRVAEVGASETVLGNEVRIEPGKEYVVFIFCHNNAASDLNKSGKAIATGVKLLSGFSTVVTPDKNGMVCAEIRSSNTDPKSVWDSAILTSDEEIFLNYEAHSASIYNNVGKNGMILTDDLFSNKGVYLGNDELNGVIYGGEEHHCVVIYKLIAG